MTVKIVLVGSVHNDLLGPARLEKAIQEFEPTVATVESISKAHYGLILDHHEALRKTQDDFRDKYAANIPANVDPTTINWDLFDKVLKVWGYESWMLFMHAARRELPIECIDHPRLHEEGKKYFTEEQNVTNPGQYTESVADFMEEINNTYHTIVNGKDACPTVPPAWVIKRNRHMANRIEQIAKEMRYGTIVHVSGLAHVVGTHPNLADMLAKYKPEVVKLNACDALPPVRNPIQWPTHLLNYFEQEGKLMLEQERTKRAKPL